MSNVLTAYYVARLSKKVRHRFFGKLLKPRRWQFTLVPESAPGNKEQAETDLIYDILL